MITCPNCLGNEGIEIGAWEDGVTDVCPQCDGTGEIYDTM
jgi:DnaJ-class molecular chaperone